MKDFARAPLVSHGYGSLAVTGWQHVPAGTTTSPYAHSAEAQALSDGGILLGLPVVVALVLLGWCALRSGLVVAGPRQSLPKKEVTSRVARIPLRQIRRPRKTIRHGLWKFSLGDQWNRVVCIVADGETGACHK